MIELLFVSGISRYRLKQDTRKQERDIREKTQTGVVMKIRRGEEKDIRGIDRLLEQVLTVHHNGRPDLFKGGARKYTDTELLAILHREEKPVFVAVDGEDTVLGYVFCVLQQHLHDNILTDIKTLYIDDLCVDESVRGCSIGRRLYEYVLSYAKEQGCYNVTLNVWECNPGARKFYEKCGLKPQKIGMEKILDKGEEKNE